MFVKVFDGVVRNLNLEFFSYLNCSCSLFSCKLDALPRFGSLENLNFPKKKLQNVKLSNSR